MRRIITAIIVLIIIASVSVVDATDEIQFRNFPWDCSPADVKESMGRLYVNNAMVVPLWSKWSNPGWHSDEYTDVYTGIRLETGWPASGLSVAGYDVRESGVYFLYGETEDGQLDRSTDAGRLYAAYYLFKFEDVEAAYDDLKGKLSKLYGEPTKESDTSIIWYGDNNTAVRMVWSHDKTNDYHYVYIKYGKTDLEEIIPHVVKMVKEQERLEAIAEEKRIREENADNSDGL